MKKKKLFLILAIISLLFSLNMIQDTYAKYVSSTNGNAALNIARWDIVVNNEHIKNNQDLTASIEPNYVDNPHVAAGVIAPGSIGYFDITIDPSVTDVSFEYSIEVMPSETSIVKDLKLIKYYFNTEDNLILVDETNAIITKNILTTDERKPTTIRLYVMWDDSDANKMTNEEDTKVGHDSEEATAEVLVALKFKQLLT